MIKGKLFSEIFDEFQKATTKQDRINVLKKYDHPKFRLFLNYALSDNVVFDVELPKFRPAPEPAGLNFTYLDLEVDKFYRFIKDHPNKPTGLTPQKQKQLMAVILESLHVDEAKLLIDLLSNKFNIPYLTQNLVIEAYK